MTDNRPDQDLLFEVPTPVGFQVRVTRAHWNLIITVKHPVMAGREMDVKETLTDPDEVRLSRSDSSVYLLELTRYLHLNPLRAGVVADLRALDRYPWTGHSALLGARPCPWQATGAILQQFGPTPARARKAYRAFVADGVHLGRRPDLQGGGLIRSLGGWRAVAALRRGREAYLGDERILGGAEFVEQCRRAAAQAHPPPARRPAVATLLTRVCATTGCSPPALHHGSRRATAARAREGVAYLALEVCGYASTAVADLLGVRPSAVYRAAQRGCANRERWDRLLKAGETAKNTRKQRPG
jgi:putative transposase